MPRKITSFIEVQQAPREILHDGKDWSTILSLNKKLDHVTLPPERRDKGNSPSPVYHQIGIIWRGSHAQSRDNSAHNDHHTALLLHRDAGCRNIVTIFLFKKNFSLDVKDWSWFFLLIFRGIFPMRFSSFPRLLSRHFFAFRLYGWPLVLVSRAQVVQVRIKGGVGIIN